VRFDAIRLDPAIHDLPHGKVDVELPSGLRFGRRRGQLNLEIVAVAAVDNALGPLEVSAQVVDELGMTEIDVQAAERPGVAAAGSPNLSVATIGAPSIGGAGRDWPSTGLWTSATPVWMIARAVAQAYAYELRRGEEILSTGWLTAEEELAPGDEITLSGVLARVDELGWANGQPRLMLQPVP
jgi:hypothetical protein